MIKMIVQVKSGHVGVKDIREFRMVMGNVKAHMGAFLTLSRPTGPMVKAALTAGHYAPSSTATTQYPKVQILTIEELLNSKKLQAPLHEDMTYRRARKAEADRRQNTLNCSNNRGGCEYTGRPTVTGKELHRRSPTDPT